MNKTFKNQDGFVALISVIILSAALLILVGLVATSGFYNRFNVLDYEYKQISLALAEGCAETALVNIAQDKDYNPSNICYGVGDNCTAPSRKKVCKICSVSPAPTRTLGAPITIISRAVYNNAYSTVSVNANLSGNNFIINSWDEQATGPAGCTVP